MIIRYVELPPEAGYVRSLLRANDADGGTLVLHTRPDIRRPTTLVHDLLEALGKRHDVRGTGRDTAVDLHYLGVWLQAHGISQVVLVESNWMRPGVLDEVLPVLAGADADLVLADRLPTADHHDDLLRRLCAVRASVDDLPVVAERTGESVELFPTVPDDDFVTFLWSCRQLLPSVESQLVERRFAAGAVAARLPQGPGESDPVAGSLRRLWSTVQSADDAVTVVRGFQAGVFRRARVSVDLCRLRQAGEVAGNLTHRSTWRRLRAYRQPYRGAVIALVAMGIGVDDAGRLPLGAVDPSGRTVVIGGRTSPTPNGAEPLLRAMRLERELDGARLDEPLLALLGEPVANPSLSKAVTDATLEVGVRAVAGRVERRVTDRDWLRQRGITIEAVAR